MPIYCNDNTLLSISNNNIESYKDYFKKSKLKLMEEKTEKQELTAEEQYLYNIINSCELILDDLEKGSIIAQSDFNMLGYADGIMDKMRKNVHKDLVFRNKSG